MPPRRPWLQAASCAVSAPTSVLWLAAPMYCVSSGKAYTKLGLQDIACSGLPTLCLGRSSSYKACICTLCPKRHIPLDQQYFLYGQSSRVTALPETSDLLQPFTSLNSMSVQVSIVVDQFWFHSSAPQQSHLWRRDEFQRDLNTGQQLFLRCSHQVLLSTMMNAWQQGHINKAMQSLLMADTLKIKVLIFQLANISSMSKTFGPCTATMSDVQ